MCVTRGCAEEIGLLGASARIVLRLRRRRAADDGNDCHANSDLERDLTERDPNFKAQDSPRPEQYEVFAGVVGSKDAIKGVGRYLVGVEGPRAATFVQHNKAPRASMQY